MDTNNKRSPRIRPWVGRVANVDNEGGASLGPELHCIPCCGAKKVDAQGAALPALDVEVADRLRVWDGQVAGVLVAVKHNLAVGDAPDS